MNIGKNIDGLINGGGTFLSPQEILARNADGSGSGCNCNLIVTVTWDNNVATLDKTYDEIYTALVNGIIPVFLDVGNGYARMYFLFEMYHLDDSIYYDVIIGEMDIEYDEMRVFTFRANSVGDYPVYMGGAE